MPPRRAKQSKEKLTAARSGTGRTRKPSAKKQASMELQSNSDIEPHANNSDDVTISTGSLESLPVAPKKREVPVRNRGSKRPLADDPLMSTQSTGQKSAKKAKVAPSKTIKVTTVKKPFTQLDNSDEEADVLMSDNMSAVDAANVSGDNKAVAQKIAKYEATLNAIAKKEALVRRRILELEEQTIPAENSDGNENEGSVDLEWPATPPPSPRKSQKITSSKKYQNVDKDVSNEGEEVIAVKAVRIAIDKETAAMNKGKAVEDHPVEYLSEDQMVETPSSSINPIVKSATETLPEKIIYLEDYDRPSSGECQILALFLAEEKRMRQETNTRVQLMDPILRKLYGSLPPLPVKAFTSWDENDTPGECLIMSNWKKIFPDLSLEWLAQGLSFTREGNFGNLARANHLEFALNSQKYICFRHRSGMCILISFLMVHRSNLVHARYACNNQKGEAQYVKSIEGFHHSVEFERLQSAILEIHNSDTMPAPMAGGRLTFSTRVSSGDNASHASSSSNMFAPALSPMKGKNAGKTGFAKSSISAHDEVLIFDARKKNFNFSSKTLDDLEKILPKYSGDEITEGSLVMVAYTMSSYLKKGVRTLSPNLNWVVLIREA